MRQALRVRRRPGEAEASRTGDRTSDRDRTAGGPRSAPRAAAYDDSDDPALAAYNHYLAWLNAQPARDAGRLPGMTAQKPRRDS